MPEDAAPTNAIAIDRLTGLLVGRRLPQPSPDHSTALDRFHEAARQAGIPDPDRFLSQPFATASEALHREAKIARTATVPKPRRARGKASEPAPGAVAASGGVSKRSVILGMVLSTTGATEAEMCAAIGWKACLVTLRRAAADAGVTLRSERRHGEKTRWFGTRG